VKFIEVKGVQFVNKGAELMLRSILQQLASQWPGVNIVLETYANSPYKDRALLGCYQKAGLTVKGYDLNAISHWLPRPFRQWLTRQFGIVTEADISAVLDASGFAYGDQWPQQNTDYLVGQLERCAAAGKPYIFLPQAFGPFNQPHRWVGFTKAIGKASLIFARDPDSRDYLKAFVSEPTLQLAPDFTNIVLGESADALRQPAVLVIPNHQMIGSQNPNPIWRARYVEIVSQLMQHAESLGCQVALLNHEGTKDMALCQQLSSNRYPIYSESDPLKVKQLISQCRFIICSRFHGCVSALSQAVPCIGTSWSHKYEALFADYQVSEWLLDPSAEPRVWCQTIDAVLQYDSAQLQQRSAEWKKKTEQMWAKVNEELAKVL